MEYGKEITEDDPVMNNQYNRYVGYEQNPEFKSFFTNETINFISKKTTQLLEGVHPENKHIVVSKDNIIGVMNDVYRTFKPPIGDIYSRFHIVSQNNVEEYIPQMIDRVIEIITSYVRNTIEMEENNKKLTIWTTVYGDFNAHGLRRTPILSKNIKYKRPTPFQIHMKY